MCLHVVTNKSTQCNNAGTADEFFEIDEMFRRL